jgi:peptidoglycan hydrolase-like protein with peptidoglycan-binding domain
MVALGASTITVSTLGSLLLSSKKTISNINQECANRNLPPAFYRANIGDGVISGNADYRFEGFGLAFDGFVPPRPKITFWVHYKPNSSEHEKLGVFSVPISIGQTNLFDLLRGAGDIALDELAMEGADDDDCEIPVVPNASPPSLPSPDSEPAGLEPQNGGVLGFKFVPLKKGAIDSVGAHRYNKTATAPGIAVIALQQILLDLGLTLGEADGWFGNNTEKALKTFQRCALEKRRLQAGVEVQAPITYKGFVLGEYDLPTYNEIQLWVQNQYRVVQAEAPIVFPDGGNTAVRDTSVQPSRWDLALAQAPTSGASRATATANGHQGGIEASFKMAEQDWPLVQLLIAKFTRAGEKCHVPASVLAAIASRESHVGSVLNGVWGDHDNGFGIMQVDRRYHQLAGSLNDPASQEHIDQAAGILASYLKQVEQKHPTWEDAYVLKGAAAAYNFGVDNVQTKAGIDIGTTGNDYGSDVLARAQFYARRLGQLPNVPMVPSPPPPDDDGDIQLSPHFKLSEMIRSQYAERHNIDNYPKDPAVINNLRALCQKVLEPMRQQFGKPVFITSGYRCKELNDAIGGARNSQHMYGQAADFAMAGVPKRTVLQWVRSNLDYDQLIDEYWTKPNGGWTHLSYRANGGNRKEFFSIPRR